MKERGARAYEEAGAGSVSRRNRCRACGLITKKAYRESPPARPPAQEPDNEACSDEQPASPWEDHRECVPSCRGLSFRERLSRRREPVHVGLQRAPLRERAVDVLWRTAVRPQVLGQMLRCLPVAPQRVGAVDPAVDAPVRYHALPARRRRGARRRQRERADRRDRRRCKGGYGSRAAARLGSPDRAEPESGHVDASLLPLSDAHKPDVAKSTPDPYEAFSRGVARLGGESADVRRRPGSLLRSRDEIPETRDSPSPETIVH